MTDADALEADVRSWLESGGYLLEMEVASMLSEFTPDFLEQGYHYFDRETGKEREGDVLAWFPIRESGDTQHSLTLVVECKNTTAPWIVFAGDSVGGTALWGPSRGYSPECGHCQESELAVARAFLKMVRGYAVTEKRNKNAVDHAYEAVQQAAAALMAVFDPADERDSHTQYGSMSQGRAIVVTRSPLFVCSLDSTGTPRLERVPQANVVQPRPRLLGPDVDGVEVTILDVRQLRATLEAIGLKPQRG